MGGTVKTFLARVGLKPRGTYSAETHYDYKDFFNHNGNSFVVLQKDGVTGIDPIADNINYMLLAERGEKLMFSDLSQEEINLLKLHFSDLTEEEIALLQKTASDAAQLANEATGKANVAAELATTNAGKANTAAQSANDAASAALVSASLANEKAQLANDAAGIATSSAIVADKAAKNANNAAIEAKNVPLIQDGTFWVYDPAEKKYVDSGSPATGKSPKIQDGIWWIWDDEAGTYVNTGVSVSSDYELTKQKVEDVLTGDITTHSHASQLAEALAGYVRVVAGKQLSTEDFTTELKNKLADLENYDDAAVISSIATINQRIETLLGGSASSAIDTFHEIETFLAGITDTKTLTGLLADLKTEITALIPTKLSQLTNDDNTVKDATYQHTDNNFTTELKNKLAGIAAGANNYVHPAYSAKGSGLYKMTVDATGHVSAVTPVAKADITALGIPAQDTNTVYTHPGYTARSSGLYKVTVDATGHVSAVAAVTKADITALGIPAQDTNTTYGLSTQSANGLMSSADKKKLDRIGSKTTPTTVANLDVNYETILVTLSANASLSANLTGANYDGLETHVFVQASGADRTIAIPTTGSYISMCGNSVVVPSGKWAEFSLKCIGGIWHIALLEQE